MKKLYTLIRRMKIAFAAWANRKSEWKEYTPAQKKIFESLRPGDLVDAWMPLREEELVMIDADHQHRVYLIAEVRKKSVLAYAGTSQIGKYPDWMKVILPASRYHVWKNGCILLDKTVELPVNCLISRLDCAGEGTLREADRRIRMINAQSGKQLPEYGTYLTVRAGDILRKDGQYYYVFGIDERIHTHHLHPTAREKDLLLRTPLGSFVAEVHKDISFPADTVFEPYYACRESENERVAYLKRKYTSGKNEKIQKHYYTHDVGEYFMHPGSGEKMIYIYSSNGRDYGVSEKDRNDPQIRRIAWEYDRCGNSADDDLITDILNRLIDSNTSRWGWLDELMVWE